MICTINEKELTQNDDLILSQLLNYQSVLSDFVLDHVLEALALYGKTVSAAAEHNHRRSSDTVIV